MNASPAALAEFEALRLPGLPAVALGDRVAHGWNPPAYAALLGVDYRPETKLAPAVLARRLDTVLDSVERYVRALPDDRFGWKPPERDRSIGDLAFHAFRLSLGFVDAMDRGEFPETWLQERIPPDLPDGAAVARYGALVRGRLDGWFQGAAPAEYARTIAVYYGPQNAHDLLERTTWHAAQHLRQLYALAEEFGVAPPAPLPVDAFEGLPLPESLW